MKSLLLILFVGVLSCWSNSISICFKKGTQTFQDNDLLSWGFLRILAENYPNSKQPKYFISSFIGHQEEKTTNGGLEYEFQVGAEDGKGGVLTADFTVTESKHGKRKIQIKDIQTGANSGASSRKTKGLANVFELLNWGFQQVLSKARSQKDIASSVKFSIVDSEMHTTLSSKGGLYYECKVQAQDNERNTFSAEYIIYLNKKGNGKLTKWNYETGSNSQGIDNSNTGKYQTITQLSEADNDNLVWGYLELLTKAQEDGNLKDRRAAISQVKSAQKSTTGNGEVDYRFEVDADDGHGTTLSGVYEVHVDTRGRRSLTSWSYKTNHN